MSFSYPLYFSSSCSSPPHHRSRLRHHAFNVWHLCHSAQLLLWDSQVQVPCPSPRHLQVSYLSAQPLRTIHRPPPCSLGVFETLSSPLALIVAALLINSTALALNVSRVHPDLHPVHLFFGCHHPSSFGSGGKGAVFACTAYGLKLVMCSPFLLSFLSGLSNASNSLSSVMSSNEGSAVARGKE